MKVSGVEVLQVIAYNERHIQAADKRRDGAAEDQQGQEVGGEAEFTGPRKLTVKKGYCPWRHCRI